MEFEFAKIEDVGVTLLCASVEYIEPWPFSTAGQQHCHSADHAQAESWGVFIVGPVWSSVAALFKCLLRVMANYLEQLLAGGHLTAPSASHLQLRPLHQQSRWYIAWLCNMLSNLVYMNRELFGYITCLWVIYNILHTLCCILYNEGCITFSVLCFFIIKVVYNITYI